MSVISSSIEERKAFLIRMAEGGGGGTWEALQVRGEDIPCWRREFWTSRQRQGHNLHEISYRACYKPQLPALFIEQCSERGDLVYDPFSGRGTTAIEAALRGRRVAANDINPLSSYLARPRLSPPSLSALKGRLEQIPCQGAVHDGLDLSMFYEPETESEIRALREYLLQREHCGTMDVLDEWIRMVATNRLTGHSPGFFSVYTLPPNQAVSAAKQVEINAKRHQVPPYRDTKKLIERKTRQLISTINALEEGYLKEAARTAIFLENRADETPEIADNSVQLTVTSPPFLDVVQYKADNWLRCWFCGLDADGIGAQITMERTLKGWAQAMGKVMGELYRVTKPGGILAFEVGEVRSGTIRLEETVLPLGINVGFEPMGLLINEQIFTKTANIWGVDNNQKGTNTNRIVLLRKS